MGNDHLCPSCARILCDTHVVPSLGSESPLSCTGSEDNYNSTSSATSSTNDSLSPASKRLLQIANETPEPLPLIPAILNERKKQPQSLHSLPHGIEVMNLSAPDGAKCNFTKQSTCRYKDTHIVICTKCENSVHVQCLLNLLFEKESKVSCFFFCNIYLILLLLINTFSYKFL
jgi:hypothetical protein